MNHSIHTIQQIKREMRVLESGLKSEAWPRERRAMQPVRVEREGEREAVVCVKVKKKLQCL
jgi:hypothetical protein